MTFSPLDSQLYGPTFTTPEMSVLFSDVAHLQRLLTVEAALAQVQGRLGVIPPQAAQAIAQACQTLQPEYAALQRGIQGDGVPVTALLAQLRAQLGEEGKTYLHWGATTQDIVDTALVLGLREALELLEGQLLEVVKLLGQQADKHRATLMAGRTHSQQALPTTFGLKAAGWLLPLLRDLERLQELRPRLLALQLGGAAGTLAALGGDALRVQAALAGELELSNPPLPWHTARDTLAELGGWLSLVTGTLGKLGQDIILLAQSEVAEVRESSDRSKGASSTMPQKSNPMQSEVLVAAARMNAGLLATLHQAQLQEHERGTHGWQLEWLSLPQMLGLTAGALRNAAFLARDLAVDIQQMRGNVAASQGLMLAEAYSFALTPTLGREKAKSLVTAGVAKALAEGITLPQALAALPQAPAELPQLHEADYLGAADPFIDRVLAQLTQIQQSAPQTRIPGES